MVSDLKNRVMAAECNRVRAKTLRPRQLGWPRTLHASRSHERRLKQARRHVNASTHRSITLRVQVTALTARRLMVRQMSADMNREQRRFIRWRSDRDESLAAGVTDMARERQKLEQHPRVA